MVAAVIHTLGRTPNALGHRKTKIATLLQTMTAPPKHQSVAKVCHSHQVRPLTAVGETKHHVSAATCRVSPRVSGGGPKSPQTPAPTCRDHHHHHYQHYQHDTTTSPPSRAPRRRDVNVSWSSLPSSPSLPARHDYVTGIAGPSATGRKRVVAITTIITSITSTTRLRHRHRGPLGDVT